VKECGEVNAWLASFDDVASRRLKYWMFIGSEWDLIWTILAAEDFYFKLWKSGRCNEINTILVRSSFILFVI
jgi:hypothetical protein